MTTLPQTMPVRLPAVTPGSSPLATVPAGSPAGPALAGGGMTASDVWRVMRAHFWLILICVVLFGIGGYFLNRWLLRPRIPERANVQLMQWTGGFNANNWLGRQYPKYSARALLKIEPKILVDPLTDRSNQIGREEMQVELETQATLLTSDALFAKVLSKPEGAIRLTRWFEQYKVTAPGQQQEVFDLEAAKDYLRENFSVRPKADSQLLIVSFTTSDPQDCMKVIEEIVNEHLKDQRAIAVSKWESQHQALNGRKQDLEDKLQGLTGIIERELTRLGQQGMQVLERGFNINEFLLRAMLERQNEAQAKATEARQMAARVDAQVKAGQLLPEVERAVEADPSLASMMRELLSYEINRNILQEGGPTSPTVQRVEKMITATKAAADMRRAELQTKYRDQFQKNVESMALQTQAELQEVTGAVEKLKQQMSELNGELVRLQFSQDRQKEWREELLAIDRKLADLKSYGEAASRSVIDWAARPVEPKVPSSPRLAVTMSLALMLGLALALGIAFLREFSNDTVRSPRDVARVGGLNLLGLIPDENDDPQAADSQLPIFDAPHSHTAEQFRQVRTRLAHAAALDTTRSIMVTGPSPEDGKTTVAANLAAGLALNGRKILLVDSNFRRPELHRLFTLAGGNERGFSDVLNGTLAFDEAVSTTKVPNLSVMASGPKPVNATELFESQLLMDFIERALEEYDHVVFDSGPFLVVSEAVAMAPRVDGVVTVVRAHSESRGLLQRMRDSLRQVKAEHVGVVLNAVRAQGGGYYGRNIKTFYQYHNQD